MSEIHSQIEQLIIKLLQQEGFLYPSQIQKALNKNKLSPKQGFEIADVTSVLQRGKGTIFDQDWGTGTWSLHESVAAVSDEDFVASLKDKSTLRLAEEESPSDLTIVSNQNRYKEFYEQAVELLPNYGSVSPDLVARELRIGDSLASRILDQMEGEGRVGEPGPQSQLRFVLQDGPNAAPPPTETTQSTADHDDHTRPTDHQDEPTRSPFNQDSQAPSTNAASTALGRWAEELLQLDRDNDLLYFKRNRPRSTATDPSDTPTSERYASAPLIEITIDEIEERLLKPAHGVKFDFVRRNQRARSTREEQADTDNQYSVTPGDIQTDLPEPYHQRTLEKMYRKDREYEEEQGLNVLWLAVGFLKWVDDRNKPGLAPLILLPCDLRRKNPSAQFQLIVDDDPIENATLQYVLNTNHGLEIRAYETADSFSLYLDDVKHAIRDQEDWSVREDIILCNLAFSKISMWQDLKELQDSSEVSTFIETLATRKEPPTSESSPSQAFTEPNPPEYEGGRLDDFIGNGLNDNLIVHDADASQLMTIHAAMTGNKQLVTHGPPGTGKSQTIANIIARHMHENRSVLFVSEKNAALKVVQHRLEEAGLDAFCLDMHRANKTEVYRQISDSLDLENSPGLKRSNDQFDEQVWATHKDQLNAVVRSLHTEHNPIAKNIYQIQGRLARYQNLPEIDLDLPARELITPDWMSKTRRLAAQVAARSQQYKTAPTSIWKPLKITSNAYGLSTRLRDVMATIHAALTDIEEEAKSIHHALGLPLPKTLDDTNSTVALLRHMAAHPIIPQTWINSDELNDLIQAAQQHEAKQREQREDRSLATEAFGGDTSNINFLTAGEAIRISSDERASLSALLGPNWKTTLVASNSLQRDIRSAHDKLEHWISESKQLLHAIFQDQLDPTRPRMKTILDVVKRRLEIGPIPDQWFSTQGRKDVLESIEAGKPRWANRQRVEQEFDKQFDQSLLELPLDDMLKRFRTDHQSTVKRMVSRVYGRDVKAIRSCMKTSSRMNPETGRAAVELALNLKSVRSDWKTWASQFTGDNDCPFGDRFDADNPSWSIVEENISFVAKAVDESASHGIDLRSLFENLPEEHEIQLTLSQAQKSLTELESNGFKRAFSDWTTQLETPLDLTNTLAQSASYLERVQHDGFDLLERARSTPNSHTIDDLLGAIEAGARFQHTCDRYTESQNQLQQDFGHLYESLDTTDWDKTISALRWTSQLQNLTSHEPPAPIVQAAIRSDDTIPYEQYLETLSASIERYSTTIDRALGQHFDEAGSEWTSWSDAPFAALDNWATDIQSNADDAQDWLEYSKACQELRDLLGPDPIAQLREAGVAPSDIEGAITKQIDQHWLHQTLSNDPVLRAFSYRDHEQVRNWFKQQDAHLLDAARTTIRQEVLARYSGLINGPHGPTLRRETKKKSRRLPIRKLFDMTQETLTQLKPCFMMSPLTVSQHLPLSTKFDTVIFDEASQVRPADAIPSIARGERMIVVGDEKQLPPTRFFESTGNVDDYDFDDEVLDTEDALKDQESILGAILSLGRQSIEEHFLNNHYRSRHKTLIDFSNKEFYGNKLLVYPDPKPKGGVSGTQVKNGIYTPRSGGDRPGGHNQGEAEQLVKHLFKMFAETPPRESFGVVAMSKPQADLIQTLVDDKFVTSEGRTHQNRLEGTEPLFVKNLESVQGDERDHMLVSVGYGPETEGQPTKNRFGPINQPGGPRRINVLITRAKESLTLFHSFPPDHITSQSEGAQLLKRYLQYAHDPESLHYQVTGNSTGEPDSDFELAVWRALKDRGHDVHFQIGVSGYKIDLGIYDQESSRYLLGIECDGDTYHSAPAARDRDFLRQKVLEAKGWTISRVWSSAWNQSPTQAIQQIEDDLAHSIDKMHT